jgi:hypothetical protein
MLCSAGFSMWVEIGREEWSRIGARIESEREMAMESGRGLEGGEMAPSKGTCRMFSTLCDRKCECECVGLFAVICAGFSGMGELWGTCCSGLSALRTLAKEEPESVSSEPK